MVNFGLNSASILGIFLAVAGASLYFMRSVKPELSRDHDIFFAAVGLLCGFILLFQGWRLDPILQFGQFLLTGSAIFFAVESIRLRGLATDQARRNSRIVDEDRPVSSSRVYRAELDRRLEPYREEPAYEDDRSARAYAGDSTATDIYDQSRSNDRDRRAPSRRPRNQAPRDDYYDRGDNPPRDRYSEDPRRNPRWQDEIPDHWEDNGPSRGRRPKRNTDRNDSPPPPSNRSRRRPRPNFIESEEEITPVDYQPINEGNEDQPDLGQDDYPDSPERRDSSQDWDTSRQKQDDINFDY